MWQMGGRRLHHLHHLPPSWLNPSKLLALEIWPVEEPLFLIGLKSPINLCFFPSLWTPVLPPFVLNQPLSRHSGQDSSVQLLVGAWRAVLGSLRLFNWKQLVLERKHSEQLQCSLLA